MSLQVEEGVVKIEGELRVRQIPEIYDGLQGLLEKPQAFAIDLSQVSKIDCAGLQLLCHLKKRCDESKVALSLINPSDKVAETLEFVQLNEFLGLSQVH